MWYRAGNARADAAPVEIHSGEKVYTVELNQKTNGSMWFELGTFELDSNAENYVLARAADDKYFIADAVRVQKAWYNEAAVLHSEVKTVLGGKLPLCFPQDKENELLSAHSALGDILVEETADKLTVLKAIEELNDIIALREHDLAEDASTDRMVCSVCGHTEEIRKYTIEEILIFIKDYLNDNKASLPDVNYDGKVSLADFVRMLKRCGR